MTAAPNPVSGAIRTYKMLSDGRRQINSFHLAGDMFGLENGTIHRFTAEAVTQANVRITSRSIANGTVYLENEAMRQRSRELLAKA